MKTLILEDILNVIIPPAEVITDFNTRFDITSETTKQFLHCEIQHIFTDRFSDEIKIKVKGY